MTIPISYHPSLDHDCVICMIHSTDYYSPFVLLGCNHTFHRKCIIKGYVFIGSINPRI